MEIAVTGAQGVLGHHVTRAVRTAGHAVRAIDLRDEPGLDVHADLRRYDEAEAAVRGADAVIHLAAHPKPVEGRPGLVYTENTTMSFNVLTAALAGGVRAVVVASSINAIGGEFSEIDRYDRFPVDTRQGTAARDEYSLSKWVLEEQVRHLGRVYGQDRSVIALRVHAVQPREVQESAYLRSPARGRRNLWGYSPPEPTARAFVRACEVSPPGAHVAFLVSRENAMRTDARELVRTHWPDTPYDDRLSGAAGLYDTSFAEAELGWDA